MLGLFLSGCGVRRGDNVVIPTAYQGTVQIHYQVNGARPLRQEAGRNLIGVPGSVIVKKQFKIAPLRIEPLLLDGWKGFPSGDSSDDGQKTGRSVTGFQ